MNTESIAATAIATVLSCVAKGGDELAKGAGKELWELIKKPFTKEKNGDLFHTLEQGRLMEFLEDNPSLAKEIEMLCEQISNQEEKSIEYIANRLLKLKPTKKKTLLNSINSMFQHQGGISEEEKEKVIQELEQHKYLKIEQNNRVTYLPKP